MSVIEPNKILIPWATTGLKNNIPEESNPVTGNAGYDQGFPAINMTPKEAGGIPPRGQDFNGILYAITSMIQYEQAGGQYGFDPILSAAVGGYGEDAKILGDDGKTVWRSTVAGNTNNPNVNPTGWVKEATDIAQILGLGTASTKNVGEGAGQIPDMSSFTVTGNEIAFMMRAPGGIVIQGGRASTDINGYATVI